MTAPDRDLCTGCRGCDDCAAYQTMTRRDDGVYVLVVNHDDTCPWLAGSNSTEVSS